MTSSLGAKRPGFRDGAIGLRLDAMKKLLLATIALLAGCHTVDQMRQRPPLWTATYAVPFYTMANCIALTFAGSGSVVEPHLYSGERRATVTVAGGTTGVILYDYRITTNADATIDVEYRTWTTDRAAFGRERADRCGSAV
jgi:hypothetical protein